VELLTDLGYKVLEARDAASALTVIDSGKPIDLLFTDVVMPGPMKSVDVARKALERVPGLVVLFTSGYTENSIVHGGRLDPGVELLSKPYGREELARKIRHVLNNKRHRIESTPRVASAAASEGIGTKGQILLVEDDALIRMASAEMVQELGYGVVEAASAEEALCFLQDREVDVVVTDLGLPGVSGEEFCRMLKANWPQIGIVFATGRTQSPSLGDMSRTALLLKPFGVEELKTALSSVL
jgi:CheY-like chemotaxis protein